MDEDFTCIWCAFVCFVLKELVLSGMGLKHIDDNAFCGLRQITKLLLTNNRLTAPPQLHTSKCCILMLFMAHNKITFDKEYFKGFKKLRKLKLTNNNLGHWPDIHWLEDSLRFLYACNNRFQSLDLLLANANFSRLIYLDVSFNLIHSWNTSLLHHMPALDRLYLCGNQLSTIDDFRNYYFGQIELAENPWHCGPELSWMISWMDEEYIFSMGKPRLICATPACLQGASIAEMSK